MQPKYVGIFLQFKQMEFVLLLLTSFSSYLFVIRMKQCCAFSGSQIVEENTFLAVYITHKLLNVSLR